MLPVSLTSIVCKGSSLNPASQVMSITILLFSFDQAHLLMTRSEDEINTSPLEADGNQEMFDFILSPF